MMKNMPKTIIQKVHPTAAVESEEVMTSVMAQISYGNYDVAF